MEKSLLTHVLLPLSTAFVLCLLLGFQATQVMRDRAALRQAMSQQDFPSLRARKVQAQVEALAMGTKRLSQSGDKNAQGIIDKLQQAGISVGTPPAAAAAKPAPKPAGKSMPSPADSISPDPVNGSEDTRKYFPVSWDELHRNAKALAWRLSELGPWQGLIAVTRGGLVRPALWRASLISVSSKPSVSPATKPMTASLSNRPNNNSEAAHKSRQRRGLAGGG